MMAEYRVTARDVIDMAIEIIEEHGWERGAYPAHGPRPRCIRAALYEAWQYLSADDPRAQQNSLHSALRRVSEAIYDKPHVVGGIMDWEHRKHTDKAAVLEVLTKASELAKGGDAPPNPTSGKQF